MDGDDATDLDDLLALGRVLDEANVRWWVDQGTCLGFVRDGGFLPWDADIDLGAWADDVPRDHPLWQRLEERGFRVAWCDRIDFTKVFRPGARGRTLDIARYRAVGDRAVRHLYRPPQTRWKRVGNALRKNLRLEARREWMRRHGGPTRWLRGLDEGGPANRALHRALGVASRAVLRALPERTVWRLLSGLYERGLHFDELARFSTPRAFFEALDRVAVGGHAFPVPHPVADYLAFKFGPDWTVPRRSWDPWQEDGSLAGDAVGRP